MSKVICRPLRQTGSLRRPKIYDEMDHLIFETDICTTSYPPSVQARLMTVGVFVPYLFVLGRGMEEGLGMLSNVRHWRAWQLPNLLFSQGQGLPERSANDLFKKASYELTMLLHNVRHPKRVINRFPRYVLGCVLYHSDSNNCN